MKLKTLEELYSKMGDLIIMFTSRSGSISFCDGLRSIFSENERLPKSPAQKKLEAAQRKCQAEIKKIKEHFAKKLGQPELAKLQGDRFMDFVLVNYRLDGDRVETRFENIIPSSKITIPMTRKAAKEADERRIKKSKSDKRGKIKYSLNLSALALGANKAAGWRPKNVVGEGSASRKAGSLLSR
jgi:hypothetical protein